VTLMESSLGGTLAVLAAERFASACRASFLWRPAVMFAKPGHSAAARFASRSGGGRHAPFFHYGDNRERPLDFAFYEDSLRYNAFGAAFSQPTLIFQGRHDLSGSLRDGRGILEGAPERDADAARRRSPTDRQPAANLGGDRRVSRGGLNTTEDAEGTEDN